MKDALGHGSAGTGRVKPFRPTAKNWAAAAETARKVNEMMKASQAIADGHPKTAPVETHPAWQHDAPQYHARVSAKNGRALGTYGPNPDRDAVIKEAFEKHPKAKTVSSSRGHGMDIRWHNR